MGVVLPGTYGRIDMGQAEEGVRKWVTETLKVDPDADPKNRTAVATVIDSWSSTKRRLDKRDEVEAEERASKFPRTMPKKDYVRLKAAYCKKYLGGRALEEWDTPNIDGFESTAEQLEDGELLAEELCELASAQESKKDNGLTPQFQPNGTMTLKGKKSEVPPPSDAEGFRRRMDLLAIKWVMLQEKYPHNSQIKDMGTKAIGEHVKYILGPEVMNLAARDGAGKVVAKPTWPTVLSYELEVRKKAYRLFNEDRMNLAAAMAQARSDTSIQQRYLHIPMSLSAAVVAGAPSMQLPPPRPRQPSKPRTMGSQTQLFSKRQAQGGRRWVNDDNNQICKRFQNDNCEGGCGRIHCCDYCLDPAHPFKRCPWVVHPTNSPPAAWAKGARPGKGKGAWGSGFQSYGKGKGVGGKNTSAQGQRRPQGW